MVYRFTNAHETLIWAQKKKGSRYTFNYKAMKSINHNAQGLGGLQMRSDWNLPLCTGKERLKINGEKAHPTQKPEALLERVIISSTNPGDTVLDPFFGSGTTGAVAKKLGRHWIGIEADPGYISIAEQRISSVNADPECENPLFIKHGIEKRIPFIALLRSGHLKIGQRIYFGQNGDHQALILADGHIQCGESSGSIHKVGREILKAPCNGWMAWYYIDDVTGKREPINSLRQILIKEKRQEVELKPNISRDE